VIERYSRPEMAAVWSEEHRLDLWLRVELAACEARESRGEIPAGTAARIRAAARLSGRRMAEIEAVVRHDVIAFLTMVAESAGDDARHLHAGMTSSDLVDTALALQLVEACGRVLEGARRLRRTVWDLAQRHRRTPMVGRTHGIHAEPITFGLKGLIWSQELGRDVRRLEAACEGVRVGKFSGAVGTLAHLEPAVEEEALARLGLRPEEAANQVVQRDRHAALLSALALLGATLEKVALEIRHLQRTEVREAQEPFAAGQKGSSSMPHKRNPVNCERVCGMARLLRGYAQTGLENVALWHERDISHSSVERVIFPDAFLVTDFMLGSMQEILGGLVVHPERMKANLEASGGLVFSQSVLLALVEAGHSREDAYAVVQEHALAALEQGGFRDRLAADPRVRAAMSPERLARCFELEPYLRNVDAIFARCEEPAP
jgi:adenylosuccinate lyase